MSKPESLCIKALLSKGQYVIPIYQRNYAWGEREISQLIQDIADYTQINKDAPSSVRYRLGSLVIFERYQPDGTIHYETIDGQQRLTTLSILLSVFKHEFKEQAPDVNDWFNLNLRFDSRQKSTDTLNHLFLHGPGSLDSLPDPQTGIEQAYYDIKKALKTMLKGADEVQRFYIYLRDRVFILRVAVPPDTDLNHYFEIMNSRGEQLEKHEVLKAKMLEVISHDAALSYSFNLIWEASSDMVRYVQYGFSVAQRDGLFGEEWNVLTCDCLEEATKVLTTALKEDESSKKMILNGEDDMSIAQIIAHQGAFDSLANGKDDEPERFTSVVNFSNFLLHVLRLQTRRDISLDDKRLIEFFNDYLSAQTDKIEQTEFVKTFGFNLLRYRFLFDKYIVKREYFRDRDQWSLKRLKKYEKTQANYVNTFEEGNSTEADNRQILMILSMFHVSAPTQVYKHWLNAALKYVGDQKQIEAAGYLTYLETLAKNYLRKRYLTHSPVEFYNLIYQEEQVAQMEPEIDESLLDKGVDVENFIFNYLDYLLWKRGEAQGGSFEFTFKSSVEHYYPRNPIADNTRKEAQIVDKFGNLCLLSPGKNARLSNHMPSAKKDYYGKAGIDSLKQKLMMKEDKWEEGEIANHGKAMKSLLLEKN